MGFFIWNTDFGHASDIDNTIVLAVSSPFVSTRADSWSYAAAQVRAKGIDQRTYMDAPGIKSSSRDYLNVLYKVRSEKFHILGGSI